MERGKVTRCPICGGEVGRKPGRGRPPKFCEAHRTAAAQAKHWRATSPLPEQHRRAAEARELLAEAEHLERQAADVEEGRLMPSGDPAAAGRWQRELAASLRERAANLAPASEPA